MNSVRDCHEKKTSRVWMSYSILAVTLLITIGLTYSVARTAESEDAARFEDAVEGTRHAIRRRLETYVALLRASSGLFAGSKDVNAAEFRAYVERLELQQRYPGIQGIGFSKRIPPGNKEVLIKSIQQQGVEDFRVWPENQRSEYHSIIYLEPLDRRNKAARGYDMFTEPTRRAAMERARDTGLPAASGRVTLVQEIDQHKQSGFLIYVPVYRHGSSPSSIGERQADLEGYVYSPFRADDLFQGIFGGGQGLNVDLSVFDGTNLTAESLLHGPKPGANSNSLAPRFTKTTSIEIAGRTWTLLITSQPDFELASRRSRMPFVFGGGVLVSLMLFLISWLQAKGRANAERAAVALGKSAAALRETERRYRDLVENSRDIVCNHDLDGQVVFASSGAAKALGYDQNEFLTKNIRDILAPEVRERAERFLAEVKSQGSSKGVMHVRTKSSETRIWAYQSILLTEGVETPIIRGIAQDITERMQAQDALRESEERYRRLVEFAPEAIVVECQGRMVFANPAAATLFGASCAAELIGKFTIEFVHHEDRKRITEHIHHIVTPESGLTSIEAIFMKLDGTPVNVEVSAMPFDYQGKKAVQVFLRDITKRKQAEEIVREADRRAIAEYERLLERIAQLAQVLGSADDLLMIFRALRDFAVNSVPCTGIFISLYDARLHVRKAVYAWSEGEEEDLSALPPMPMNDSPHSRAVATGEIVITNDFQSAMGDGPVVNVGLDKDPRLPQSSLTAPMAVMGRILGAIEVQSPELAAYSQEHATAMRMAANLAATAIENVMLFAREREKEEQLRQSQKMEAVGKLAGGVAHDFNNLLTAITGYSELSLRCVDDSERIRRNLQEIIKAGDRAAALTRQLLAFSRKQVLRPKIIDLNAVIVDLNKMLRRLIGEDIDMLLVLRPDLGKVKADPSQVEQVLMNLLVNARDAMPVGGKLTIETANIYIDEQKAGRHVSVVPGQYVMLSVSDTGCGMDADTQARIFEPFFTTKGVGKGTGLGLSTVYGVVQQSGGDIWVYSEVGKGTTFKIYLPRVEEPAERVEQSADAESPTGTETVLLVEDEAIVRDMTREILQVSGYRVLEAQNGHEALKIFEEHQEQIHLMLTDVIMPQMSGRELAEEIAKRRPEVRLLYMSGYTDDAIGHHGVLEKGVNFLEKPFSPNALTRKIREVLDQARV